MLGTGRTMQKIWTNGNIIQGDSKPLRQTLRVDRATNKEHFLLNNLCILTRGFKANTGALLWFHFYSAGWKKIQDVFKVCALYLITFLHRRDIACRTLTKMLGLCLIWSNAVNIRSISPWLVLTGLMYTTLFTCLQRKKSRGVRSGDLGGHGTGRPLPIHFSL